MKPPRYSLRTMLIAVAIIAAGVGYVTKEARFVAERKAFLAGHLYHEYNRWVVPIEIPEIPWIHRCLGSTPVWSISVDYGEEAQAERLFPEAMVVAFDLSWGERAQNKTHSRSGGPREETTATATTRSAPYKKPLSN
jgi:hypothetical protein